MGRMPRSMQQLRLRFGFWTREEIYAGCLDVFDCLRGGGCESNKDGASTVIGEEFNLLTWVMMGNVVSSLMDIVCNVDWGRIVS